MSQEEKKLQEQIASKDQEGKELVKYLKLISHRLPKALNSERRQAELNTNARIERDAPSIEKINELYKIADDRTKDILEKGMMGYDSWVAAMSQIVVHCQMLAAAINAESTRAFVEKFNAVYLWKTQSALDKSQKNVKAILSKTEIKDPEQKEVVDKKLEKMDSKNAQLKKAINQLEGVANKHGIELPSDTSNDDMAPRP